MKDLAVSAASSQSAKTQQDQETYASGFLKEKKSTLIP